MKRPELISSPENPKYKIWKSLLQSKGIKKNLKALLSGKTLVHEYFKKNFEQSFEILYTSDQGIPVNLGPQTKAFEIDKLLFKELDIVGSNYPLLCVPTPEIKAYQPMNKPGLNVFLPLGDPKNLGGALRNCLAFNVDEVILLSEAAHPFHPQAIKSSSGAVFNLNLSRGPSIKDINIKNLFILDKAGKNLNKIDWPEETNILVGEEGMGLPEDLKEKCKLISIPISEKIESLNANQALGITLYQKSIS